LGRPKEGDYKEDTNVDGAKIGIKIYLKEI
jgi:hypothetical protein